MAGKRRVRGEGAVFYSESKGCWIGRAIVGAKPDGRPKYKEVTARTQGQALAKMRAAEADAGAGRLTTGKPLTVGEHLDHWLHSSSKTAVHESTWNSYERVVRLHLKPHIGGIKLAHLRPSHLETLFADLTKAGVSKGNAKKVSEVLSTALQHAVRFGLIPSNPITPVPKPRPDETPILIFSPEEISRIRAAAAGHRLEALVVLAIASGAREGELLALGREHLFLDAGQVRFERSLAPVKGGWVIKEPKSKRGRRTIDLPAFAMAAMRERCKQMLAEGNAAAPVLFCTKTGQFISKSSYIRQVWRPLLKRAGVPYRKFHALRHTHVSELLAAGVPITAVARRIGDRPDVILKTYAHAIPGDGDRVTTHLEALYNRQRTGSNQQLQGGVKVESA
jgi:integrase